MLTVRYFYKTIPGIGSQRVGVRCGQAFQSCRQSVCSAWTDVDCHGDDRSRSDRDVVLQAFQACHSGQKTYPIKPENIPVKHTWHMQRDELDNSRFSPSQGSSFLLRPKNRWADRGIGKW